MEAPSSSTSPPEGDKSPAMMLNRVDFPQPLGPRIETNAPRGTSKLTSSMAVTALSPASNRFDTPRTLR